MSEDLPSDDLSILDRDRLLRRVKPNQLVNESDGTTRPSSAVFRDPELSVNIESVMADQGRSPSEMLDGLAGHCLTSITPGIVREFDRNAQDSHPVVRDSDPPNDSAHALVLGKKTKSFRNAMVRGHEWVVRPSSDI